MKAIQHIYVVSLQIRQAPLVHPVFNRPFVLELTDTSDITAIADAANSAPANLLPYDIAKIAPGFISIGAPTQESSIPNGYDTARCSYILTSIVEYGDGSRNQVIIEGYTSDSEIVGSISNMGGKRREVNPNEKLYMVSVKVVALPRNPTATYGKVKGISNVILPDVTRKENASAIAPGGLLNNLDKTWQTQRPDDMFSAVMVGDNESQIGAPVIDLTNSLGMDSLSVNVSAISPAGFTSTVVNSYANAVADVELDADTSFGEVTSSLYSSCHSRATSTALSSNDLIMTLRRQTDSTAKGFFTIQDLYGIDETFNKDRVSYSIMSKTDMHDYRDYMTPDHINVIPGEIASLVNILVTNILQRADANMLNAVISNRTHNTLDVTTPYVVQVLSAGSIAPGRESFVGRAITKMLTDELCPLLSARFDESWLIEIKAKTIMETTITVKCEGFQPLSKTFPTYAATTYSPVLVPPGIDTGMVNGFSTLIDIIGVEDKASGDIDLTSLGIDQDVAIY